MERLYDEQGRRMFLCAVAVTRCRDLAEDAVHEVFCRHLRLERAPENLTAYALRSVRNAAIDLVRRNARVVELDPDGFFDPAAGPLETAQAREFRLRAEEAMAGLPEDERETILQHIYADLTFREIAELLGVPLATAASRYRRGMERLRERLEE